MRVSSSELRLDMPLTVSISMLEIAEDMQYELLTGRRCRSICGALMKQDETAGPRQARSAAGRCAS